MSIDDSTCTCNVTIIIISCLSYYSIWVLNNGKYQSICGPRQKRRSQAGRRRGSRTGRHLRSRTCHDAASPSNSTLNVYPRASSALPAVSRCRSLLQRVMSTPSRFLHLPPRSFSTVNRLLLQLAPAAATEYKHLSVTVLLQKWPGKERSPASATRPAMSGSRDGGR